jgi:hypothetical protein
MFYTPELIFGSIDSVGSRFHVLRSRTHFRRYRGRRVPFSCFELPDPFLTVPTVSDPVFKFLAPEPVFGGADGVGSHFHVFTLGLIFGGTEGVVSHFNVLHSWTHFRQYQRRQVSFSCFAFQDPFSALPTASGLVFMFCAPGLIFGDTESVRSRFHVLSSRTRF